MPFSGRIRPRRLRQNKFIRDWVSETSLSPRNIILPYFVVEGYNVAQPIESMNGVYRLSVDNIIRDLRQNKRIQSVLLFGVSKKKDEKARSAYQVSGVVQKAIVAIKKEFKNLVVMTDVCLCGYTTHGHCGVIRSQKSARQLQLARPRRRREVRSQRRGARVKVIDNDATLKVLAKIAVSHAGAGADFVAPSAMMDGQVGAIREALDKNGFKDTGIMAYSAKYASSFYSPFRDALDSAPSFGDRKTYQMDWRNTNEALKEIRQDIDEGADIVMVKPALAYLDIIYRAKQNFNVPIAAYNVSGEYSLVKAYCQKSEVRSQRTEVRGQKSEIERELVLEILTSIKRAGADFIITYWAKDVLGWLG